MQRSDLSTPTVPDLVLQGKVDEAKRLAEECIADLRALCRKCNVGSFTELVEYIVKLPIDHPLTRIFSNIMNKLENTALGIVQKHDTQVVMYVSILHLYKIYTKYGEEVLEKYIAYITCGTLWLPPADVEYVQNIEKECSRELNREVYDKLLSGDVTIDSYIELIREAIKIRTLVEKIFGIALSLASIRFITIRPRT